MFQDITTDKDKEKSEIKPGETDTVAKSNLKTVHFPIGTLVKMVMNKVFTDDPLTTDELRSIEESFNSVGFMVEENPTPKVLPWYAPVIITMVLIIVPRVIGKLFPEGFDLNKVFSKDKDKDKVIS